MRNCDARITGEVENRSWGELRNRSTPVKAGSIIAVLVVYWGTALVLPAALQQNVSSTNAERVSRPPVITAKPEHVTLTNGSGSTEIEWDTGNGSIGFVFVTEEDGKPIAFASGSRGTQIAPWIGKHSYLFELYGDDQRKTLLAKITVSGSAGSTS